MGRPKKEYAYYNRKDECVAIGTKEELAAKLFVEVSTIDHYTTPAYRRRTVKGIRVIAIEEDEE